MNDRKVLIYEDDPATLEQINSVLSALGVQSVTGEDPAGVVEKCKEANPDLIILSADVKHGFSACLKIKKDKTLRRLPLFMIAGKTPPDVISKHQRLPTRADVYLTTPLSRVILTEILREQLPALPPQPEQPRQENTPTPAHEIDINENGDHTIVSNRNLGAEVVNYVEDEVRDLKSTVVLLQTEKQDLDGKIGDLESMLKNQSETLTSSFKAMQENQEALIKSSQNDSSAIQDLNKLIDDAVREAVAHATEQANTAAETARQQLEDILAGALAKKDELQEVADAAPKLQKAIHKLEKQIEDTKKREKERKAKTEGKLADVNADAAATQELFGRLESGYKDTINALEEERDSLQDRISEYENDLEKLREKCDEFKNMAEQFPVLQEAAAKNEILSSDNSKLQKSVDRLQDRNEELESVEVSLKENRKELKKQRQSEEAIYEELIDIKKKFKQVQSLLGISSPDAEDDDDEKSPEEDPA